MAQPTCRAAPEAGHLRPKGARGYSREDCPHDAQRGASWQNDADAASHFGPVVTAGAPGFESACALPMR
eukprot:CAMPEP_0198542572 /NCGR_PEP_ID=MMETSP1462-20131121/58019_1 /TAXON_ID=1333877 /ORGANISM="Brandtodinium nutriculum, Strain RCC3387" /LENGTH=68 /DNA_ID=CAMNT_0044272801 /DNA_START=16 /DNA_END=218 /DNA_ORIENTATION=-